MALEHTGQLFHLTRELNIYGHSSFGSVITKYIKNFPFFHWPNYEPCLLANTYMLSVVTRPTRSGRMLSTRGSKGGTVGDYASKISHLIRYCYFRRRNFIDIDDTFFTEFISVLRSEKENKGTRARRRTEKTIRSIGKRCLDFLRFVGNYFGDESFVSKDGAIKAYEEIYVRESKGKKFTTFYFTHHSFSQADTSKKRDPISKETISLLRSAIDKDETSKFRNQRRHCLISLLEFTGARVGEIALLTVDDILRADAMDEPSLKLMNLKQAEGSHRYIPVTRLLLNELKKHIRTYRYKLIKETIGSASDHGLFFISESSGRPISDQTLSKEVGTLRRIAKISGKACAHMFRHAFCTNLFVLLIKRHDFENADSFRRMLLDSESFKLEVMQWTGHKRVESLDYYINYAFGITSNYTSTVSSVRFQDITDIYDTQVAALMARLEEGMSYTLFKHEMDELKRLRDQDFGIAMSRSNAR